MARHYKQMIYAHLNEQKTYKKLECSIGNKITKDLYRLIAKYNSCLVEKETSYFINISFKGGNFYGLPKKQKQIINYKTCSQVSNIGHRTFRQNLLYKTLSVQQGNQIL